MEEVEKPMKKPKPKETVNRNPTSQELTVTDTEKRLEAHLEYPKDLLSLIKLLLLWDDRVGLDQKP
jgi:hypothetical protein